MAAPVRYTPEQQLRHLARLVEQYTETKRHWNGKLRSATYAERVDTIAQAARQLAEMVEQYLDGNLEPLAGDEFPF